VNQLVRASSAAVERSLGTVWVEGETASVTRPSSGHLYFCLVDAQAQVRAVMWRSDAARLRFRLEDGLRLRCRGRLGIYERDGRFQIYVSFAEPAGLGAEALALEQLRARLAAEGLFARERKRPLPLLPRRIGVVTSRTGAAVRDIIRAVQRRFPVPILVADTMVQGPGAPQGIVRALRAIAQTDVDVVIVGRGGGSATDLSAFNDEAVVRAVAACPVPIISAVGHEIDVSLTDLVADHRAATPTMAGEMAVPVRRELQAALDKERRRLDREMRISLRTARQELDQLLIAARGEIAGRTTRRRRELDALAGRLRSLHPRARLLAHRAEISRCREQLDRAMQQRLAPRARSFGGLAARLDALSPLRVLERGYALATRDRVVLEDARQVAVGDTIAVRLARGTLDCRVVRALPGDQASEADHADRKETR
jgi:exodeoxyribonuclease VII large subunit